MRTVTLHNLDTVQATTVAATCPQGRSYGGSMLPGSMLPESVLPTMRNLPWANEILVEGAAFARGSKDPIQEALL